MMNVLMSLDNLLLKLWQYTTHACETQVTQTFFPRQTFETKVLITLSETVVIVVFSLFAQIEYDKDP